MSSKHQNIKLTVEQENFVSLLVLDIKICRKSGKFVTGVYRKPTYRGVFTNYEGFIPTYQKRGLFHTLLRGSFSICCDFKTFHFEIDHLKTILMKSRFHWIPRISLIRVLNYFLISCIISYVYTIVVCSVFNIMSQFFYFTKNRMYEHLISF